MDIPRDRDIIGNVIAAVSDDTPRCLLKQCQCTLVSSSSLLPTSRKQLFSKISLKGDQTCQGIHQFLVQNPVTGSDEGLNDIQPLVRTIALTDDTGSRRRKISLRFKNPDGWMAHRYLPFSDSYSLVFAWSISWLLWARMVVWARTSILGTGILVLAVPVN